MATVAVAATSVTTAIVTGATPAIAPNVQLMAVVAAANSTSQFFAGTTYYGTDYASGAFGDVTTVPFFVGPQGIADAIAAAHSNPDGKPLVVLASGWGAGQAGTALAQLQKENPDALKDVDLVILDNNTNRAGGGFWTTYSPFAPLLLTDATPTANNLPVHIIDTAYEYNVNSDAVTYPLNVVSDANSLVAYFYGYGGEKTAKLPDDPANLEPGYHYVVDPATGKVISKTNLNDQPGENITTTYVTFEDGTWETDENGKEVFVPEVVPLLRPLKLVPGGDIVADTFDPIVREIVNAGYKDNQPIPADPTVQRTMGLGIGETVTALGNMPGDAVTGLKGGAATAQEDVAQPANFVTKPIDAFKKLPLVNTVQPSTSTNTLFNTNGANRVAPETTKTGATSSTSTTKTKPLKRLTDDFNSSSKKFAAANTKPNKAADNTADNGPK
ncbi:hypothetical protein A5662_09230 [Mycobacteriaceae bacterium 1482268.1]|nr:hypothetical protein A5662_09230 [Mycobacteriaceae bacterium 1482268.1]